MKALLFILLLSLFSTGLLYAQNTIITGTVKSNEVVIPNANVELINTNDINSNQHSLSDSAGHYSFEIKHAGKFFIKLSYIGYADFNSKIIEAKVSGEKIIIDILLREKFARLEEVIVAAKKQVFETDEGKLIFNVQNSALSSGQTVFDLLKNIPGVSIGQNDEILFRGSAGINIMMNRKMTYLSGNQLVNYLKGMSAADLSKIELITTPTAEFDASGNAGIINIVSKKSIKQSYAVIIRTSVSKGKFWMNNQNIATSFHGNSWSINGMFDFKTPHSYSQSSSGNTISNGENILQLRRENESAYTVKYYTWNLGADWQFFPKHKIGINYHGYFDDFKSINTSVVKTLNKANELQHSIRSVNNVIEPYHYDAVNLNYKFDIDSLGNKITADAHYTSYRNFSDGLMTTENYSANGSLINKHLLKSKQPGFVEIKSAQADADLPFKKIIFKTGLKYAEVENDNKFRFDTLQAGSFAEAVTMSNHFKYKERIAAVYLSGSKKIKNTSLEAGIRLEHTYADGHTVKLDMSNKWEYTKLFPSLVIEQAINGQNKVSFSVSKRINRPSYVDLNSVRWYTDQYFYYSGNPNLVPELAWVFNLTYSLRKKYILSTAFNQSNNYINRKLIIDNNGTTIKSQSANFGTRYRFDFTASAPIRFFSFWDVQLFSDISYTRYPISMLYREKELSLWAAVTSLQQNFDLSKEFKINLAGYYNTAELRGIYVTEPAGWIDFGIKKSFLSNKMEAQFSINDVLNTNRYGANSKTDITDYYYRDNPYGRTFNLSLRYHFGGDLIKSSAKKTEEQERL